MIFNQDLQLLDSPWSSAGSCSLRQNGVVSDAAVFDFEVFEGGFTAATLPGSTAIGGDPWRTKGPKVNFGRVYWGYDSIATRFKFAIPRKADHDVSGGFHCAGSYLSGATTVFNVNRMEPPSGNGMSLTETPTAWTCGVGTFGTGVCNCNCGVIDPDCTPEACP